MKTVLDVTPSELAGLANQLPLLGTTDARQNKSHLLFACTPGTGADMGVLLKTVLPQINGKGGGNAHWSQGGGGYTDNLDAILVTARQALFR